MLMRGRHPANTTPNPTTRAAVHNGTHQADAQNDVTPTGRAINHTQAGGRRRTARHRASSATSARRAPPVNVAIAVVAPRASERPTTCWLFRRDTRLITLTALAGLPGPGCAGSTGSLPVRTGA